MNHFGRASAKLLQQSVPLGIKANPKKYHVSMFLFLRTYHLLSFTWTHSCRLYTTRCVCSLSIVSKWAGPRAKGNVMAKRGDFLPHVGFSTLVSVIGGIPIAHRSRISSVSWALALDTTVAARLALARRQNSHIAFKQLPKKGRKKRKLDKRNGVL